MKARGSAVLVCFAMAAGALFISWLVSQDDVAAMTDTQLLAPVSSGQTVTVVHGYNDPMPGETCVIGVTSDHCANQRYGLDLSPSNQSDRNILAPMPGEVAWESGGCMGLKTADNLNLNICHFSSFYVVPNTQVVRGTILGQRSTSWVHLSLDDRYSNPSTKPAVPFSGSHTFEGLSLAANDSTRNQYSGYQFTSTNESAPPDGAGNTATVTDIPNPDTYSCSKPGFLDFEGLPDQTNLSALSISGIRFTTTNGYTWIVSDSSTGKYNGKYPNGEYMLKGTHSIWLGKAQGAGRIDLTGGPTSYFSVLTSNYSQVYLDAYDAGNHLLATAGPAGYNLNTGHMAELKITRATPDIAYVMLHDTGNFWIADAICTNAPGVPGTIDHLVDNTHRMQTGDHSSGNFVVNLVAGVKHYLHVLVDPFFSDVDLVLTRPDGTIVAPGDPGVIYDEGSNFIEVGIDDAQAGEWHYEIIANQLEAGGEDIHITVDDESIAIPNEPPTPTPSATATPTPTLTPTPTPTPTPTLTPTPTPTATSTPTPTPTPPHPPGVGGKVMLPPAAIAAESHAAADDSGWTVGAYAALAAGSAFLLLVGAWYARRRWLH